MVRARSARVERRDAYGLVVFPDSTGARRYLGTVLDGDTAAGVPIAAPACALRMPTIILVADAP
jgi:hypothetical protein